VTAAFKPPGAAVVSNPAGHITIYIVPVAFERLRMKATARQKTAAQGNLAVGSLSEQPGIPPTPNTAPPPVVRE